MNSTLIRRPGVAGPREDSAGSNERGSRSCTRAGWLTLAATAAAFAVLLPQASLAQCPGPLLNWADHLGYGVNARVVMMHADDAGSFRGANEGILTMLQNGTSDSASVMVPGPYYADMVSLYDANQDLDIGLHLTLNSRKNYRWGPVHVPQSGVKRILKHKFLWWGWYPYFPSQSFYSWLYRGPQAVERELVAQINQAVSDMQKKPTHVDSHVGSVFIRKSHFERYLDVTQTLGVPALTFEDYAVTRNCMVGLAPDDPVGLLAKVFTDRLEDAQDSIQNWPFPRLDHYCVVPYDQPNTRCGTRTKLGNLIAGLPPGITQILFHPADEDPLMRYIFPQEIADRRILIDRRLFDFGVLWSCSPETLDIELNLVKRTNWRKMKARFDLAATGDLCSEPTIPGDIPVVKPQCCTPP